MEKVNKKTKVDILDGLKKFYPEVFEDGKINFEKLKTILNGELVTKEDDRFYFNWAGKGQIFKLIQAPAYGTLKPVKEKSVDFDTTENIVIVGENLETLKLLLKPYFGKIKMIYIDPPYNTGKDFIYRDNFKQPTRDYLEKTGQIDSEGNKLTTNTEASGRYHSDWLNFMYPRLYLARNLLSDDGVIFVSIDDHEVHHLRMIMDEIFGEGNFVACFIRRTRSGGGYGDSDIGVEHDYILSFSKIRNNFCFRGIIKNEDEIKKYFNKKDEIGFYHLRELKQSDNQAGTREERPYMFFPFIIDNGKISTISDDEFHNIYVDNKFNDEYINILNEKYKNLIWPIRNDGKYGRWTCGYDKAKELIEKNVLVFENGKIYKKERLEDEREYKVITTILNDNIYTNTNATFQIKNILPNGIFNFPKPNDLIKFLSNVTTLAYNNDIILDFFAGSGTTGHAVWDLNKEDGGNRKFILVQLDEEVQDEEIKKEFPTVADICIERLKRVSEKYKTEAESTLMNNNQDFGFKVFKLDKSNFNLKDEFEFDPSEDVEELKRKYIEWLGIYVEQPLIPGWNELDVIYEVILKEGLNLNSKIEKVRIKNCDFYYVKDETQNLDFYIYLKDQIDNETIEEIRSSTYKNKTFVFLDNALTDNDKINLSAFVRLKVI